MRAVSHPPRRIGGGGRPKAGGGGAPFHPVQSQSKDPVGHDVRGGDDVAGRNAQDLDALRRKPRVSSRVPFRSILRLMDSTVDLDREMGLDAIEIQHVESDRVLTAENRPVFGTRPRRLHSIASGAVSFRRSIRA